MKTALLVLAIIALAFAQSTNPDIVGSDPVTTPDEQGPSPDGNPDPIYAQYSEGLCEGSDCCELVKSCLKDLKVNANIDDPEIGAPWRTGSRCPFPVCAHGYHYDPLGSAPGGPGTCVKYRSPAEPPLRHEVYRSLMNCLSDYARASASHCSSPLETAWRKCKIAAGFD